MRNLKLILIGIAIVALIQTGRVSYKLYYEPVKIVIKQGYQGPIVLKYRPSVWRRWVVGDTKEFEINKSGICYGSRNPFDQYCEIQVFVQSNSGLRRIETNYELVPSTESPKFYVIELRDENNESWFVYGDSKDLELATEKARGWSVNSNGSIEILRKGQETETETGPVSSSE